MSTIQASWPFPTPNARPAAPTSDVRERHLRQPRGSRVTEIEFRGRDRETVQKAAELRAHGIDAYRSPGVQTTRLDGEDWISTLRYYNAD